MRQALIAITLLVLVGSVNPIETPPEPPQAAEVVKAPVISKKIEKPPQKPEKAKKVIDPQGCEPKQYWAAEPPHNCIDKPPKPIPASARPAGKGGVEQWRALVSKYNWNVETVLRIMRCESGGNQNAVGDRSTAYASYGLMQIRALPGRPSPNWLLVPENNIAYAYQLSGGGANFNAWTCY